MKAQRNDSPWSDTVSSDGVDYTPTFAPPAAEENQTIVDNQPKKKRESRKALTAVPETEAETEQQKGETLTQLAVKVERLLRDRKKRTDRLEKHTLKQHKKIAVIQTQLDKALALLSARGKEKVKDADA